MCTDWSWDRVSLDDVPPAPPETLWPTDDRSLSYRRPDYWNRGLPRQAKPVLCGRTWRCDCSLYSSRPVRRPNTATLASVPLPLPSVYLHRAPASTTERRYSCVDPAPELHQRLTT